MHIYFSFLKFLLKMHVFEENINLIVILTIFTLKKNTNNNSSLLFIKKNIIKQMYD